MKALLQAMRKLETSQTPLTRKRARRAIRAAVAKLLKAYPSMGKDGKARHVKGAACPICRIPCRSWADLARHLYRKHCRINSNGNPKFYCPACGKDCNGKVAQHLAALHRAGKLHQHVVCGATETAFGGADS